MKNAENQYFFRWIISEFWHIFFFLFFVLSDDLRTANIICDSEDGVTCLVIDRETFKQSISNLDEIRNKYNDEGTLERKRWEFRILTKSHFICSVSKPLGFSSVVKEIALTEAMRDYYVNNLGENDVFKTVIRSRVDKMLLFFFVKR